jgi:hypothetical protein
MLSTIITVSHLSMIGRLKEMSLEGEREMMLFLRREDGEKLGWGN